MEEERDRYKVNRSQRQKLTEEGIGKLKNCDRPLTKNEWREMSIEKRWAASGVMGFLKEANQTESTTATINVAQEEYARPKSPPPQAPWEFRTYPEDPTQEPWKLPDPASGSGNHLGDAEQKGKGHKGKDPKGKRETKGKYPKGKSGPKGEDSDGKSDPDGKDPNGEDSKGKASTGKGRRGKASHPTTRRWKRRQLSLIKKEMAQGAIIFRRRHGGGIGYR